MTNSIETALDIQKKQEQFFANQELKERVEHREALIAINSFIQTEQGKKFFYYLLKNFNVLDTPDEDLEDKKLYEALGFWKAGNSIFKLMCEANAEEAALLLAKKERDNYEYKRQLYELNTSTSTSI